jgi:protein-S-isoprenylcysteine O-methyltransferase Ste14
VSVLTVVCTDTHAYLRGHGTVKELRLISLIVIALGAVLALSMFVLMQYSHSVQPTSVPIVPGLLLMLGLAVAAVGVLLLAIALAGLYFKSRQIIRSDM